MQTLADLLDDDNAIPDYLSDPDFLASQQAYFRNYVILLDIVQDVGEYAQAEEIIIQSKETLIVSNMKPKFFNAVEHCYESLSKAHYLFNKKRSSIGYFLNINGQRSISFELYRAQTFFLLGNLAKTYESFVRLHTQCSTRLHANERYADATQQMQRGFTHFCTIASAYISAFELLKLTTNYQLSSTERTIIKNSGELHAHALEHPLESLTFYDDVPTKKSPT